MPFNREVADALEVALKADPHDVPVRLRLTRIYLDGNHLAEADHHATLALGGAPDDPEALKIAIETSLALGNAERARRYRRLLEAILPATTGEPDRADPPQQDSIDHELRQLLADERRSQPITLADVAGMPDVKRQLELSLLGPMRNAELRAAFAVNLRGGLLLWGPPGCGKTFLARAVAGELGANFIPVAFRQVIDPHIGITERNLHAFFEEARRLAPSVLFFDEVDAIGATRSRLHNAAWLHNLVGTFLTELDGMDDNTDVFVLAATNQPWDVDPALRRPGRFDRTVLVLPPDREARLAILDVNLRHLPVAPDTKLDPVADMTDGLSGADLVLVCRHAAELAMEETMKNDGQVLPVTLSHLMTAARSVPASTLAWLDIARNYALYANEHGEMDGLVSYMRSRKFL